MPCHRCVGRCRSRCRGLEIGGIAGDVFVVHHLVEGLPPGVDLRHSVFNHTLGGVTGTDEFLHTDAGGVQVDRLFAAWEIVVDDVDDARRHRRRPRNRRFDAADCHCIGGWVIDPHLPGTTDRLDQPSRAGVDDHAIDIDKSATRNGIDVTDIDRPGGQPKRRCRHLVVERRSHGAGKRTGIHDSPGSTIVAVAGSDIGGDNVFSGPRCGEWIDIDLRV